MKSILSILLMFALPFYAYSNWEDFIDTTIVSSDSLVKIVNKGESEGAFIQRNVVLKIYYKNQLVFKLENPKEICLQDTSDNYIGIEHLTSLPLITVCEKIDSTHYILLGYNLSDKRTGKFIWILEVQKGKLIIFKKIAMLSYRSPDNIEFFVNHQKKTLFFNNSSNKVIGDHVYIIDEKCEDVHKLLPDTSEYLITHYIFPGITNSSHSFMEDRIRYVYIVNF